MVGNKFGVETSHTLWDRVVCGTAGSVRAKLAGACEMAAAQNLLFAQTLFEMNGSTTLYLSAPFFKSSICQEGFAASDDLVDGAVLRKNTSGAPADDIFLLTRKMPT